MAPRSRKPKTADTTPDITLIPALEFAAGVYDDAAAEPHHSHVLIDGGWLYATNGVLSVGHPLREDLSACPQPGKLLAALRRCKGTYSLTHGASAVSVKAGAFSASVHALDPSLFPPIAPDAECGPLNDDVRKALQIVEPFTAEAEPRVVCSSVLLQGNSCVATDGVTLAEAWHGYHLPPDVVLSKKAVQWLCKVASPFRAFGFSDASFTVYFESGAWAKLQRYQTNYVDYARIFPPNATPRELPGKLFETVKALLDFDDCFVMRPGSMTAEDGSATFELDSMPEAQGYDSKRFLKFETLTTHADFTQPEKAVLFGNGFRGLCMQRRV